MLSPGFSSSAFCTTGHAMFHQLAVCAACMLDAARTGFLLLQLQAHNIGLPLILQRASKQQQIQWQPPLNRGSHHAPQGTNPLSTPRSKQSDKQREIACLLLCSAGLCPEQHVDYLYWKGSGIHSYVLLLLGSRLQYKRKACATQFFCCTPAAL